MIRSLPPALVPFDAAIARTVLPLIGGTVLDTAPATPSSSQLGGLPWWPAAMPYPVGRNDKPLYLLAQINFADCAPLEPFPAQGLLQFFIGSTDDYLYGCNLDDLRAPNGFAGVYHTNLDQPRLADFGFLTPLDPQIDVLLPLEEPLRARAVSLSLGSMPVDVFDHRFRGLLPAISGNDDLLDLYQDWFDAPPVRLGGYPTFTQNDPRDPLERHGGPTLGEFPLLTIESTDGIMWGDMGVGQFFMHEADLRRLDFTKVAYNWDCC